MDIAVTVTGTTQLVDSLNGLLARAADLHPVFELIADDFAHLEAGQFASEGGRGGQVWAPLRPATIAARGSAHPILHVTGQLEDSLTSSGAMGAVREITGMSLTVGTKIPYAGYLQSGTRRMPARPPVNLTGADHVRWAQTVARYVLS